MKVIINKMSKLEILLALVLLQADCKKPMGSGDVRTSTSACWWWSYDSLEYEPGKTFPSWSTAGGDAVAVEYSDDEDYTYSIDLTFDKSDDGYSS